MNSTMEQEMPVSPEQANASTPETRTTDNRSRRNALLFGGAALAGLALGGKKAMAQSTVTDTDILNFALNLEYLEAQYYTLALTGKTLEQSGISTGAGTAATGGTVTVKANPTVTFTTPLLQQLATEIAKDEQNHVTFLRSQLGASAVAQPNIDLMTSFNTLAAAAGIGATFDPFANETNFLLGAFIFEDVGVTAYQGAAALISNKTYLDKAVGIHNVEAYHAGAIRTRIFQAGATAQALSQAIANTRAKLDGTSTGTPDDAGVSVKGSASVLVPVDANAMTFARTTTQVLSIVYGGGSGKGVFYPAGMNGTIK